MTVKHYEQHTISDEFKEQNIKYTLSKQEDDLYNEEDDIANKVIRVKRVGQINKGEKWKIIDGEELLLVIEGIKMTKKEKIFLRSVDGINFLIRECRKGAKSFNAIKILIKKEIKKSNKKP